MSSMCGVYVKYVWCVCQVCVVCMPSMCGVYAKYVWCVCQVCVVCMPSMCGVYAKYVWCVCKNFGFVCTSNMRVVCTSELSRVHARIVRHSPSMSPNFRVTFTQGHDGTMKVVPRRNSRAGNEKNRRMKSS